MRKRIAFINFPLENRKLAESIGRDFDCEFFDSFLDTDIFRPHAFISLNIQERDLVRFTNNAIWFNLANKPDIELFKICHLKGLTEWIHLKCSSRLIREKLKLELSKCAPDMSMLSPTERKIYNYLSRNNERVYVEELQDLLWAGDKKNPSMLITNLKKKLRPYSLRIIGNKRLGWQIEEI